MKLVFCKLCQDVVRLQEYNRACKCGESGGGYTDDLYAYYWGFAIPLGFSNPSLVDALKNQPESGMGLRFEAFVIPKDCETMTWLPDTFDVPPEQRRDTESDDRDREVRYYTGLANFMETLGK